MFASAELYDPASETWSVTGSLQTARAAHAATLLPNGMILVEGGYEIHSHFGQTSLSSAELYDPTNGSWTLTSSLGTARCGHTATLLQNGKVLVAGGYNSEHASYLGSAELYDPASGTWTATDSLTTTRASHTATLLQNGMVLVAGGQDFNGSSFASAEVYDPESGTWTATGSLNTGRYLHTATLLPNGMVLVAGGARDHFLPHPFAGAELYDPTSGAWTVTGDLNLARFLHTATLLENGTVLVTGGVSHINASSASVELYDSASGIWRPAASLNTERYLHTATLLSNGKVLVAAGVGYGATVLESAEQSRGHSN